MQRLRVRRQDMELPCDEGLCLLCRTKPDDSQVLLCNGCSSPWHMSCLRRPLESVPEMDWFCPDCNMDVGGGGLVTTAVSAASALVSKIKAIQEDSSLTEAEKARKRQELVSGRSQEGSSNAVELDLDDKWSCSYCLKALDRPVTTPCGHNYCLSCLEIACFKKNQKRCPLCRATFEASFVKQPRINWALATAIRMAKVAAVPVAAASAALKNQNRPDKAFVTERAKKAGLANASSGKLFVNTPKDHFGPILKEHDTNGLGVPVGQTWLNRMECRQAGIHLPHVAGIAGQAEYGAQSVVLSGGYEDDEDHGEWFLYTGSGGRDLKGNKRTNKVQSSDQTFTSYNEALRTSCRMGFPVRVVRSYKERRSVYAPDGKVVRYDGIYRVDKCWRKPGIQGKLVCRYLFVRCDDEPAPWTSDTRGDVPRPLPEPDELKDAFDVTGRLESPHWGWKEEEGIWTWLRPQPASKAAAASSGTKRKRTSTELKLKKEFACGLCKKVLQLPVSTPCAHNFCQSCLGAALAGDDVRQRGGSGRSLRVQKVVKPCPRCGVDISEFMINPKVNLNMENIIQSLRKAE